MKLFSSAAGRRYMAGSMMALLLLPIFARADTPAIPEKKATAGKEAGGEEAVQPKFIWGILIKFVATKAFDMFFDWAGKRMFHGMTLTSFLTRETAVTAPGDATLEPVQKGGVTPIIPNVTDSAPSTPVKVENGKENYQGALLSLLVLQADGETLAVRPVSAGFKSGEKFRIRIGSTFGGDFSLDNINPHGERSRLYPADSGQVVRIKPGVPVILPLEKDSFFQFDSDTGEEKLVVTLRDPRAQGATAAQAMVHRQESEQGTGLLQEVAAGKFASIAETIPLQHRQ